MTKLRFRIAMSLDGYTAGPQQSRENPLGIGRLRLHDWALPLAAWRAPHGLEGGEVNESTRSDDHGPQHVRRPPGPVGCRRAVERLVGVDPPFPRPVFVLTHHARAARGLDVSPAGGASTARQYLTAGLVDEMEIHLVPMLLGAGERLFEGVRELGSLELARTVAAPDVTHLKFVRR